MTVLTGSEILTAAFESNAEECLSNICYVENIACCIHYFAPLVLFICGAFS